MLTIARSALLAALTLATLLTPVPATQAQPTTCQVAAAFAEDLPETRRTLIKLLFLDRDPGSVLNEPETARLYLLMLQSTRRHYEAQAAALPPCAEAVNTTLIATITATQDVLTLRLADHAAAQPARTGHAQQARAHLEARWLALSGALDRVTLAPADR